MAFGVSRICSISLDVRCDSLQRAPVIELRTYHFSGTRTLAKKQLSHNRPSPIFHSLSQEKPGIHSPSESTARSALVLHRLVQVLAGVVNVGEEYRSKDSLSCRTPHVPSSTRRPPSVSFSNPACQVSGT